MHFQARQRYHFRSVFVNAPTLPPLPCDPQAYQPFGKKRYIYHRVRIVSHGRTRQPHTAKCLPPGEETERRDLMPAWLPIRDYQRRDKSPQHETIETAGREDPAGATYGAGDGALLREPDGDHRAVPQAPSRTVKVRLRAAMCHGADRGRCDEASSHSL